MKSRPTRSEPPPAKRAEAGFTLSEVLAALVFMAIVIPVTIQAVRIASQAGQVAERKAVAARIADSVLNQYIVTANQFSTQTSGTVVDNAIPYTWSVLTENWTEEAMNVVSVQVVFNVQGQPYDVTLRTLLDPNAQSVSTPAASSGSTGL